MLPFSGESVNIINVSLLLLGLLELLLQLPDLSHEFIDGPVFSCDVLVDLFQLFLQLAKLPFGFLRLSRLFGSISNFLIWLVVSCLAAFAATASIDSSILCGLFKFFVLLLELTDYESN